MVLSWVRTLQQRLLLPQICAPLEETHYMHHGFIIEDSKPEGWPGNRFAFIVCLLYVVLAIEEKFRWIWGCLVQVGVLDSVSVMDVVLERVGLSDFFSNVENLMSSQYMQAALANSRPRIIQGDHTEALWTFSSGSYSSSHATCIMFSYLSVCNG